MIPDNAIEILFPGNAPLLLKGMHGFLLFSSHSYRSLSLLIVFVILDKISLLQVFGAVTKIGFQINIWLKEYRVKIL